MRVVIEATPDAVCQRAAAEIADLVRAKPAAVLGLATGHTMLSVYAELVRLHRGDGLSPRGDQGGKRLSLESATSFNLDEYVGMSRDDPRSFHSFMREHLVDLTDLPPASAHLPDGHAGDLFVETERYEAAIAAAGGLDLQLLGLGKNGHLGFNEPGSSLGSFTRVKTLTEETLAANREDLPDLGTGRPQAAITMGLGTILGARRCLLLALGASKAEAVKAMIEGPLTARLPASVLQMHRNAMVILDDAAAAGLADRDYYLRSERLQRELERKHTL